jgi:hypothetical protein
MVKYIRPLDGNIALGLSFRPTDKYQNSCTGLFVRREGNYLRSRLSLKSKLRSHTRHLAFE